MPADSRDTREALLRAGRERFARGGYDGASIRSITSLAGANLGAITYHFGSKRSLYTEVLRRVIDPLRNRLDRALGREGPPLDRVEAVVRAFFDQLRENPDQPFLILQEIAAGKPPPGPVLDVMRSTLHRVATVIAQGQADGSIRAGDPLLMLLSAIAQPVYMSLVSRVFRGEAGPDWDDPAFFRSSVEHAVLFVRQGLASHPMTRGGRP